MNDKKNTMPPGVCAALLLGLMATGNVAGATWQVSAGATTEEGGALELSRRSGPWELALGYVTEQRVDINYIRSSCPWKGAPPEACITTIRHADEPVDPFAYLSVQRRFEFRRDARLRPLVGVGLVGISETNEYVSTLVNLSLSLGLRLGERVSVEWRHFSNADADGPNLGQDTVLLRWQFR